MVAPRHHKPKLLHLSRLEKKEGVKKTQGQHGQTKMKRNHTRFRIRGIPTPNHAALVLILAPLRATGQQSPSSNGNIYEGAYLCRKGGGGGEGLGDGVTARALRWGGWDRRVGVAGGEGAGKEEYKKKAVEGCS